MGKFEKAQELLQLKEMLDRRESEILAPLATRNAQGIRRVPDDGCQQ